MPMPYPDWVGELLTNVQRAIVLKGQEVIAYV